MTIFADPDRHAPRHEWPGTVMVIASVRLECPDCLGLGPVRWDGRTRKDCPICGEPGVLA